MSGAAEVAAGDGGAALACSLLLLSLCRRFCRRHGLRSTRARGGILGERGLYMHMLRCQRSAAAAVRRMSLAVRGWVCWRSVLAKYGVGGREALSL